MAYSCASRARSPDNRPLTVPQPLFQLFSVSVFSVFCERVHLDRIDSRYSYYRHTCSPSHDRRLERVRPRQEGSGQERPDANRDGRKRLLQPKCGKYPMADTRQGTDTLYGKSNTAPGNEDVFNVLRAIATGVNASDVLNPRKIIFFSGKDGSSRPRSAFATVATTDTQGKPINIGAFVDPYGNAYMVAIDGSYDGATVDSLPYTDITYATGNTVRVGCFAESFGKDGVQGRKQSNGTGDKKYSGSDDVLSWQ